MEATAKAVSFPRHVSGALAGIIHIPARASRALNFGKESGRQLSGGPSRRIADDKFGLNLDDLCSIFVLFDSLQQGGRGYLPHPFQWLPHRGETRVVMNRNFYVIEPHHRDVLGNSQSVVALSHQLNWKARMSIA
jgi:hypothetical protein